MLAMNNTLVGVFLFAGLILGISGFFASRSSPILSLILCILSVFICIGAGWLTHFLGGWLWAAVIFISFLVFLISLSNRDDSSKTTQTTTIPPFNDTTELQNLISEKPDQDAPAFEMDIRTGNNFSMDAKTYQDFEDEEYAKHLIDLFREANAQYDRDKAAYQRTRADLLRIGQALYETGGDTRMHRVALIAQALGGKLRDCEYFWDGIGSWKYKQ